MEHALRLSFKGLMVLVKSLIEVLMGIIEQESDLAISNEVARHRMTKSQVTMLPGVLINEMARELMCLEVVVNDSYGSRLY